jgi:hypothetical protein
MLSNILLPRRLSSAFVNTFATPRARLKSIQIPNNRQRRLYNVELRTKERGPYSFPKEEEQRVRSRSDRSRRIFRNIAILSGIYVVLNLDKAPYTGRIRLLAISVRKFFFVDQFAMKHCN